MRVFLSAVGVLIFAVAAGPSVAAPDTHGDMSNLPGPVAAWIAQAKQDCPAGFQMHDPVQTVSLTGDGKPGYIADPHRLSCAGEPHVFSGDGPASIELFVTLPSGDVVHTGGVLALSYQVENAPNGGPPILAFTTHASGSATGSIEEYRWDGRNFTMLNRHSMAEPPVNGPDSEYQH
jgi:hypothetical protein